MLTPPTARPLADRLDGPVLARTHGKGFLYVLTGMVAEPGLYVLDELESACPSTAA